MNYDPGERVDAKIVAKETVVGTNPLRTFVASREGEGYARRWIRGTHFTVTPLGITVMNGVQLVAHFPNDYVIYEESRLEK